MNVEVRAACACVCAYMCVCACVLTRVHVCMCVQISSQLATNLLYDFEQVMSPSVQWSHGKDTRRRLRAAPPPPPVLPQLASLIVFY